MKNNSSIQDTLADPMSIIDNEKIETLNQEALNSIDNLLADEAAEVRSDVTHKEILKDLKEAGESTKTASQQTTENVFSSFKDEGSDEPSGAESIKKLANADLILTIGDLLLKRVFPLIPPFSHTDPKHWELTEEEKRELKPAIKEVIKEMKVEQMSPGVVLLICVLIIYGFKAFVAIDSKPEQKEKEAIREPEILTVMNPTIYGMSGETLHIPTVQMSPARPPIMKPEKPIVQRFNKDGTPSKKTGPKGPRETMVSPSVYNNINSNGKNS